ncbi:MAG: twin-arginine translocase TatA/TatE family subunit [Thermoplasmata archaeon]|nr:MAG: twin-arginine translocase TatA/TatE family subunit [Thermoplasmata archaeon]
MAFVGMEWIVVIIAIILFLFGAKKIPEFARSLGKARGEFDRGKRMVELEMLSVEKDISIDPLPEGPSSDPPPVPEPTTSSPIKQAATEFGIETEGRSDQELKEAIRKRVTGE